MVSRLKTALFWAALLGLGALFVRAVLVGSPLERPAIPGELAPPIALQDLKGAPLSLASLRGRPVLVNFWATWCTPCRAELPELQRLAEEAPGCLAVLGVTVDSGGAEKVEPFVRERGLTYPIGLDSGAAALAYKVFSLPHSVLIGPAGEVLGRFRGKVTSRGVKLALAGLPASARC